MAYLRFGEEFGDEELVALFDSIEIADLESGHHPPDALTRELIDVMQARGIGDREELASMLVQLDDRAREKERPAPRMTPGTPITFKPLPPGMPRTTINFVDRS